MHPAQLRLWVHEHVGYLDIHGGVAREADPIIAVNTGWVEARYPHMLGEDGVLRPDENTRYRPLGKPVLPDGFTAYQRIQP